MSSVAGSLLPPPNPRVYVEEQMWPVNVKEIPPLGGNDSSLLFPVCSQEEHLLKCDTPREFGGDSTILKHCD